MLLEQGTHSLLHPPPFPEPHLDHARCVGAVGRADSGRLWTTLQAVDDRLRGVPFADTVRSARARAVSNPALTLPAAVAAILALAYLLAPLTGQDLSAQIAHADFARRHPLTPVDLRWFGGTLPFGYSLWTPLVTTWIGVKLTGAVCSVVATVQLTVLFQRAKATRPGFGGVVAALAQTVNLVQGRVTFSLGMVCGLAALLLLPRRGRSALAAVLAGAASPVAALLLWLGGGALILRGRWRDGAALLAGGALPVLVIAGVFGDGGHETFSQRDARDALLATAVVAIVVPLRQRTLRLGALLGLVMVLAAYFLDTPVGNNAARLSLVFAAPVVAAFVNWRPWLAAIAVVASIWPQQLADKYALTAGPSAQSSYYAPLVAQLRSHGPLTGRVEVPETQAHWDTAYLAREVPLARGWLRQVDLELNDAVFFQHQPSPDRYLQWLQANSVQYVAVPDAKLTAAGQREVAAASAGPSYLSKIWSNKHWTLYAVGPATPIVRSPGQLTSMSATTITLTAPATSTVTVQIRWFRWLSLHSTDPNACIEDGGGQTIILRTGAGGRYSIDSTLLAAANHCR
jgi:hypothetical protein